MQTKCLKIKTTAIQVLKNAKLTLTDKSAEGTGEITSGPYNFESGDALVKNFGTFNMTGGKIQTTENVYYALAVFGEGSTTNISGGEIVSNWEIEESSQGVAIGANGKIANEGYTINITGGEITGGEQAMYLPSSGTVNISGGKISGTLEGVEIRAGYLNISGGTISATAPSNDCDGTNSGATGSYTGALVAVKSQYTTADSYNGDIIVHVTGGTIENNNEDGYALCVVHEDAIDYDEKQLVQVTVEDRAFIKGDIDRIGDFANDDSDKDIDFLYIKGMQET